MDLLATSVLVAGLAAGAPALPVGMLLLTVHHPLLAAPALIALWVAGRLRANPEGSRHGEAVYLAAVASELRAGSSLRQGLGDAADRVESIDLTSIRRLARTGADHAALADAIRRALPGGGSLAAPAVRLAALNGGRAAAIFDRLAVRLDRRAELGREIAVAAAQAQLSARVLLAVPAIVLALLGVTGHVRNLVEGGTLGLAALGAGLGLQLFGALAVALMMRRARR